MVYKIFLPCIAFAIKFRHVMEYFHKNLIGARKKNCQIELTIVSNIYSVTYIKFHFFLINNTSCIQINSYLLF